ncbi:MAG: hypothetical protein AB7E81_09300 [Hyphomicrobiaceae bacterium]
MPPLIAAMLVGAGAYAGVKAFQRILASWSEIEAAARQPAAQATPSSVVVKDLGALEFDPATGVYRPVKPLQ